MRVLARSYYRKLLALAEKGDTERPELKQARTYLGK